ncbi:conserved hypothetical protein [Neospora caninum Liverpool]|uniref:PKD/REJ-like domain-containing protein n=1 Tax=Neospora caninum (strain Liverpool) TaxID=572307 RepID=F0VPZ2_NEOCL|nr:conserved hypothetical protein [Neospora caninum Liverpool]CBZ55789.1 conserved hypothetical protein [Neospora caninum Liverpool]|eukprot:XP_003885815.1 conserved hypothetical protein [Neospora caninum Liverpool]
MLASRSCPKCATPLQRVVNGHSGMVVDVPGEAIFEAAKIAKRANPSLSVFSYTLRVEWAYNWVEGSASVAYEPFVPYFSVPDGTVWTVKNDERRFAFTVGVYACTPYEKTIKWTVQSANDPRTAAELLEIDGNLTTMHFTVSLAPISLLPGERYSITLEVSYVDAPSYKGSTTIEIDVEQPRPPIAQLQMPDSVEACDTFQIDASASKSNAPDNRLEATWQCVSGCNAAINDVLRRQKNKLMFTVGSDVVFAMAKTHRDGNTGGSTFLLQIQLTLTNSYKVTSTATSTTRIAVHLQPPEITSLTPTAASVSHKSPYTMGVDLKFCNVAGAAENQGLDIRWTVKSKEDPRDLNQILQLSDEALSATFPAYSLKPAAAYTVSVAVTYLDDTRVKSYASFELQVRPAPGFPPVIQLQYPTVVRNCQPILLDATETTSSASEPGLTVSWACVTADCPREIKELAEAEKTLALTIPDDIVYGVVEQLLGSTASAESLKFTIVLEVKDRDMRTASASATLAVTKELAPPTVSPTTATSFELEPSQTATMGIAVAQCPHFPAGARPSTLVEWSVSPDGRPFKLQELVDIASSTPTTATTKAGSLVRGLAYTFEARAFYRGSETLASSAVFRVLVDKAGTVPPSVSLTGPEGVALTACEGFSVQSTASAGNTDDPTVKIYWICFDADCPAEYVEFLEHQANQPELLVPPAMVYKLAKANRQKHPTATTFMHRVGVVVLNSDRRQATDSVQVEIENYPASPTLQPAGPLNFNIDASETVTMAVAPTYCTHADDFAFTWEIKSEFENRPSTELLTESQNGYRATVEAGKLIGGVTYTVVVSLAYGDLPSPASLVFEITVAPPGTPAAHPTAVVTHRRLTAYCWLPATTQVSLQSSLTPPTLRATSQQTLQIENQERVTLSAEVDYCEHVKTDTSSGLSVEWRSTSTDPRPFEDLFSVSDNQLIATAEPGSLHAGTDYTIKLQVAYEGNSRQHQSLEYTVLVQKATLFLSFNVDTLPEP